MKPLILAAEKDRIFACAVDRPHVAESIGRAELDAFEAGLSNLLGKRDVSRIHLGEEFDHRYLTRGEVFLLKALVTGSSCLEISERLNISSGAVDKHVKNIKGKLDCKTLYQMGFVVGQLGVNVPRNLSDW